MVHHQAIAFKLADMANASELLTYQAAKKNASEPTTLVVLRQILFLRSSYKVSTMLCKYMVDMVIPKIFLWSVFIEILSCVL